jgi:hypothetical protein
MRGNHFNNFLEESVEAGGIGKETTEFADVANQFCVVAWDHERV